jgi:hypothetical protein
MTKTGEAARPTMTVEAETLAETFILYRKQIITGAIVIAAGAGGFWLWQRSGQIKEEKAGQAYQSAESAFAAGNQQLAQTELEKITTRYAGTSAGTQASMLSAQILFDEGKFPEGIAVLEAASSKAPVFLRAGIQALIGGGYEGAGKPTEAAAAFGKASTLTPFEGDRDMYRMEQARNLAVAGDRAGAEKLYATVGDRDDSPYGGEAKIRLGELTAVK